MEEQLFLIKKTKAEAALYTLFILAAFISFLTLVSFGIFALILSGIILSVLFLFVRKKLAGNGKYYIKVNDKGIEFRTSIFSKPAFLPWEYVNQVNFHLYEVNLRLRETNKVINLQTNYLHPEQVEDFTELVRTQFKRVSRSLG